MTDTIDHDWSQFSRTWRADAPDLPHDAIRARVRAGTTRLALSLAGEVAITVVAGFMLWSAARAATSTSDWLLLGGLTLFSLVLWTFTMWNRRGIWRASGETLAAYEALERRRLQRLRRAARFTWMVGLAGIPPLVPLLIDRWRPDGRVSVPELVVIAAIVYLLGCAAFGRWREHRLRAHGGP